MRYIAVHHGMHSVVQSNTHALETTPPTIVTPPPPDPGHGAAGSAPPLPPVDADGVCIACMARRYAESSEKPSCAPQAACEPQDQPSNQTKSKPRPPPPSSTTTTPLSSNLTPPPPRSPGCHPSSLSLFSSPSSFASSSPYAPAAGQRSRRVTPLHFDSPWGALSAAAVGGGGGARAAKAAAAATACRGCSMWDI